MEYKELGSTGIKVSQIGLGTVEIGVPGYGISKEGLIPEKDAVALLRSAVDMGVTYFDTARGYGEAEVRIGKSGIVKTNGVTVGTKCGQFLRDDPTMAGSELEKKIREEIDTSRKLLGYETLPLVQLHIELADYTNLGELIEIMSRLKDEEKVAHVGIASRGFDVPKVAIESGFFETIQVAYSILDQRMDTSQHTNEMSIFELAQKHGVGVINRSVLLQGALSPAREYLPSELAPLRAQADAAATIADELGITLPVLAIRFALSHPAVSTALIGTTKPERVQQAADATKAGALPREILTRLYELGISDIAQIDPAQWPKKK